VAPAAVAIASDRLLRPQNLPVTRFNSVVSPHRVFETRRFTEAEFDRIRTLVPGASFDDAVFAVCGGALRSYLASQGDLPAASLSCIVPEPPAPASDSGALAAPLAWRHASLGTDIADPLERLQTVHTQSRAEPDAVARLLGSRALAEASEQASATLLAWGRQFVGMAGARIGTRSPPANATLAHVPGPAQPMYLCGARLSYFSAILPIHDGLGLAFAVTRFDGRVVISPTSCRELMPDPEVFAQCLRDSFQDYLALAKKLAQKARRRQAARRAPKPAAAKAESPRVSPAGKPRRARPKA